MSNRPVFLLTDFGPDSGYVGQMKAVIHALSPKSVILDLAHDIPAQNVTAAALLLSVSFNLLPNKSVVVAVVDPGVGSDRKIIAMSLPRGITLIAPDNGLAYVGALIQEGRNTQTVEVTNAKLFRHNPSPVFHGRDIFAPVAARVAKGLALEKLGPAIENDKLETLDWPAMSLKPTAIYGEVIYVDRFGNAVTNIDGQTLHSQKFSTVKAVGKKWPLVTHYAEVPLGARVALVGSFGLLELAVRNGSAKLKVGDRVEIKP